MDVLTCIAAASWGGVVGFVFVGLLQAEAARVVTGGVRAAARRRFVRWAGVSGALFVPAIFGTAVIATLAGFDIVRRLALRLELRRGD